MSAALTQSDVERLSAVTTPSARVELAAKVARLYDEEQLKDKERRMAEDILRILVLDKDVSVRETLAEHLKDVPELPRDIAKSLAEDIDPVALPVLRWSDSLQDSDLMGIVVDAAEDRRLAIARRPRLSAGLVNALITGAGEAIVLRVLGNDGAEIDDITIERLLTEHGHSSWVLSSLASRGSLPSVGARRLLRMIVKNLTEALRAGDILTLDDLSDGILSIRQVCVASGSAKIATGEMDDLIAQLHANGRLEPSLLLRTLCLGDLQFFDLAMARMADIPIKKAHRLIHEKGTLGLETIFMRTGLPVDILPAVQIAVEVAAETRYEGMAAHRGRYVQRMLERMLNELENPDEKIPETDIEYLLDKLQRNAA